MLSSRMLLASSGIPTSGSGVPVTANLALNLSANTIVGYSNNDPLALWANQATSGSAYNGIQSSPTLKPIYKTNIVHSLPAVYFDNVDDAMTTSYPIGIDDPFTIFLVSNFADVSLSSGNYRTIQGSNDWFIGPYTKLWVYYDEDHIIGPDINDNNFVYMTAISPGATGSHSFRVNGTLIGTSAKPSYGPGTIGLGAVGAHSDQPAWSYVAELLIYSAELSSANINAVEYYLKTKYAL